MKIAVASGKGGTGKTLIATNLAVALSDIVNDVTYIDCDVEEPNGHIFFKPEITEKLEVSVPVPRVDESKCTLCGDCGRICQYSAIVALEKKVLVFDEMCHGCGGCSHVCPVGAISEYPHSLGIVEKGIAGKVGFIHGKLHIGRPMSPPVIKAAKKNAPNFGIRIFDSPPGTSCPVIESIKDSDFIILVTEPTPFGLNDLKLAVGMVRELGIKFGVLINRCDLEYDEVDKYCDTNNIKILMKINDDRKIAEVYSRGELIVNSLSEYKSRFIELFKEVERGVAK